jgi:S-DNA-T family DNA segregation ATPase FtsK/SpoIIIE
MRMRLNLEIAGIAAFGLAMLLGIALVAPARSGAIGAAMAHGLVAAFGEAAWLCPILVAIFGGIVFLEINVPRMIGTLGFASLCYFIIADAFYGTAGGAFGTILQRGLRSLVGTTGATLFLIVAALAVTVWITNVSVKRVIGLGIVLAARLRAFVKSRAPASREAPEARAPAVPAIPRPTTIREAFNLPAEMPKSARRPAKTTGAALATIAPVDARTFIAGSAVAEPIEEIEDEEDDEELDDDEIYDEDDLEDDEFEDDDEDDEEELEDEDEIEDEDELEDDDEEELGDEEAAEPLVAASAIASPVVVGEYEPVGATANGSDPERRTYRLPDLSLFDPPQAQIVDESHRSHLLEDTLASFGVGAKVTHIERGPSITRYELKPERGVKISRISALADDIALALAATSVRIEAPIPGKSAVGIEVPNAQTSIVAISEILQAIPQRGTVPPLHMALGKDITGRPVFGDLGKMPHLLVAGATGSGKSVCLNGIIASLLVSATPDQVQMLFIDPKRVELTVYNGIPHLIKEVITDARLAAGALFEMTREMDSRYERFAKAGVRKIEEYNAKFPDEKLPFIVIIIDELADLMLIAPAKVETTICRLAQLARATGIHLVVATQRPSVDVITGLVKANIPSRIAFAVSSQIDSRTILDMGGAERLLGRGDMLYLPIDAPKPIRAQGALITGLEVTRLVEFWANQARPDNLLDVEIAPIEDDDKKRDVDPLCYEAAKFIIETDYASTAQLQSRFSIGHPRAVRVMKHLEEFGIVGQHEGTKPRRINVGLAELETIADRLGRTEQTDLFAT